MKSTPWSPWTDEDLWSRDCYGKKHSVTLTLQWVLYIAVVYVYWAKEEFAPFPVLLLVIVVFDANEERNVHFHPPDLQTTVHINLTLSKWPVIFQLPGRLTKSFIISRHFALTKVLLYNSSDLLEVGADVDDAGREVALSDVGHWER